jgi:hypothetical protein
MGPPAQDMSEYRGLPPYHQNHIVNGNLPSQVTKHAYIVCGDVYTAQK